MRELVEQGIVAPVAIALHHAIIGGAVPDPMLGGKSEPGAVDDDELARASGLLREMVDGLIDAGAIVAAPGPELLFDATDVHVARLLKGVFDRIDVTVAVIGEIAAHIRAASAKEMNVRNRAARELDPQGSAELSGQLQEVVNFWHAYMFARARQLETAIHGLGPTTNADESGAAARDGDET